MSPVHSIYQKNNNNNSNNINAQHQMNNNNKPIAMVDYEQQKKNDIYNIQQNLENRKTNSKQRRLPNNNINKNMNTNDKNNNLSQSIIEEIMATINYNGPIDELVGYIKNLKQKEDLADFIQENFKGKNNNHSIDDSFQNAIKFMKEYDVKEKQYLNEISMYKSLCNELIKRNPELENCEELSPYFSEIEKIENLMKEETEN